MFAEIEAVERLLDSLVVETDELEIEDPDDALDPDDVLDIDDVFDTDDMLDTDDVVDTEDVFDTDDVVDTDDVIDPDVFEGDPDGVLDPDDVLNADDVFDTDNVLDTDEVFDADDVLDTDVFDGEPDVLTDTVPEVLLLETATLEELAEVEAAELDELFVIGDSIVVWLDVVELVVSGIESDTGPDDVDPETVDPELPESELADELLENPELIDEEWWCLVREWIRVEDALPALLLPALDELGDTGTRLEPLGESVMVRVSLVVTVDIAVCSTVVINGTHVIESMFEESPTS